jgi:hypothetical protein
VLELEVVDNFIFLFLYLGIALSKKGNFNLVKKENWGKGY